MTPDGLRTWAKNKHVPAALANDLRAAADAIESRIYTLDQIEAERNARRHNLKTWPEFFAQHLSGEKTFELRNDDRNFEVGDVLHLMEFDPTTNHYSGREIRRIVTSILRHRPEAGCAATFGLSPGYVVLSIGRN